MYDRDVLVQRLGGTLWKRGMSFHYESSGSKSGLQACVANNFTQWWSLEVFLKRFFSFVQAATPKLQTVLKTVKAAALGRHTQADPGWSASATEHRLALSCPRSSHQRRTRDEEVSKKGSKNSSRAIRKVDVGSSSP